MYYWKLDDETIRCLINKEEIVQMGFTMEDLRRDNGDMEHFLEEIIRNSRHYVNWNTENGMQTYSARELPSDQLLITISCTYTDVAIDRDLDQIRRMTEAFQEKVPIERIRDIMDMKGEEKEEAFEDLTNDLQDLYMGNFSLEEDQDDSPGSHPLTGHPEERGAKIPAQVLIFKSFGLLQEFCRLIRPEIIRTSMLYKKEEAYHVIIDFREDSLMEEINAFMNVAQEFGGDLNVLRNEDAYLSEHARLLLGGNAIAFLANMN